MTQQQQLLPNRAGMVCFNVVGHVLVVSALGKTDEWVLPKGHIETVMGSLPERGYETAEREVWEETGIKARVLNTSQALGVTVYEVPKDAVKHAGETSITQWFAGQAVFRANVTQQADGYKESDFRVIKWLPWRTALDVLSYPDQRDMLRRALCLPEGDAGAVTRTPERELANF